MPIYIYIHTHTGIPEEKYNVHLSVKEEHWIHIDILQK